MKSLELINEDLNIAKAIQREGLDCYEEIKELETIKQDLEVLEILRKYMELTNGVSYRENFDEGIKINLVCFGDINDLDTKEDYNKLKQWLEEQEQ